MQVDVFVADLFELGLDIGVALGRVTSTAATSGSCSAWLIRFATTSAASAVSSARSRSSVHLGRCRPGLEQPLGGDRVMYRDDQVHLGARPDAVREHGDRLGTTDGAPPRRRAGMRTRDQGRIGVHSPAELALRRTGGAMTRRRSRRGPIIGTLEPAARGHRHVETHPVDRRPAVSEHRGRGRRDGVPLQLVAQVARSGDRSSTRRGSPGRAGQRGPAPPGDPDVVDGHPSRTSRRTRGWRPARAVRTASQIACTAGTAASTSKSARARLRGSRRHAVGSRRSMRWSCSDSTTQPVARDRRQGLDSTAVVVVEARPGGPRTPTSRIGR